MTLDLISFAIGRDGVTVATPVVLVTVSWVMLAVLVAGAIAYRRQTVRVRRAMRRRQLSRVGA